MLRVSFLLLLLPFSANAAITFVNAATERFAAATTVSPSEPASVAEDDLFLANCSIDSDDGTWTDPAGWTQIDSQTESVGTQHWYIGYIVRGASTPALGWSYSGTGTDIRCTIYAFRGIDTASPLDVSWVLGSHYGQTTDSANSTNPAITTNTNGAVVVLYDSTKFQSAGTPGAPSGYTLDTTGDGSQPQQQMAYKTVATAGTETPGAWTHTGFGAGSDHMNHTLAIKPAATTDFALYRRRGR
jgi:hypothetical protein